MKALSELHLPDAIRNNDDRLKDARAEFAKAGLVIIMPGLKIEIDRERR
jgi:hypothetical protein